MKEDYIDLGERGRFNKKNKLNELTGKEWIKFTKSWFIHSLPTRKTNELLHPAKFPETLVREFIEFFTKKGEWVFDPFLGTGSTLIAAGDAKRNGVGIELNKGYFDIAKDRISAEKFKTELTAINGNSMDMKELLADNSSIKKFDYVITSPPYWNQLIRNNMRQKQRGDLGLDTKYSDNENDIGNIDDYQLFIDQQAEIFDRVFDFVKDKGYLTIITNNVFFKGALYPLAYDTAISLTKRGSKSWTLKDEKIWLQNDKSLVALGINNAWVGNRHHQFCLIFRKEERG